MRAKLTIGVAALCVAVGFIACRRGPDMEIDVGCVHLEPSNIPLDLNTYDSNNNFGHAVHDEVRQMHLMYEARGFSGGAHLSRGVENDAKAHVLLLVPETVRYEAELPVPRAGDVIYILRNGQWEPHPAPVRSPSRHTIRVIPDARGNGVFVVSITGIRGWPDSMTLKPDGVQ